MTDHFTDALFSCDSQEIVTLNFPVSRFVVDPGRCADGAQAPMAVEGHRESSIRTRPTVGACGTRRSRSRARACWRASTIARAFYGVPESVAQTVYGVLDKRLAEVTRTFMARCCRAW